MRTLYSYASTNLVILAGVLTQINPTLYGTASLLEVLWTASNGGGAIVTVGNLSEARKQLRAARDEPVDALGVELSLLDVVIQVVLLLFQTAMLGIGIIALFTPPPLVPQVATLANLIATVLLIGGSFMLTGLSVWIARKRKRILRMLPEYGNWTECTCDDCIYKKRNTPPTGVTT